MTYNYKNKLSTERESKSRRKRDTQVQQFYSDRSRVLYSSSFRRLQQKAQVFSLESNASVRTRMTHSLEVSDLGRTLANDIAQKLCNKKYISVRSIPMIVAIVENACLIHDIGNPPFGHFGEAAIKEWSVNSLKNIAPKSAIKNPLFDLLMSDFEEFDGNPQGFRTITKLHTERDEFSLNLTYATLLCSLKYSRASGEKKGDGILKKAGYYQSEKALVEKIYRSIGLTLNHRYPLTYIMEAADDIAYCMSDIADGIEKRILTENDFIEKFEQIWNEEFFGEICPVSIPKKIADFKFDISIPWSIKAMDEAANNYIQNHDGFYNGTAKELIPYNSMGRVLETIKQVSQKILYTSIEAESIELTGFAVITGILKHYEQLLKISSDDFDKLVYQKKIEKSEDRNRLEVPRRLFNRIGKRYVKAYKCAIEPLEQDGDFPLYEWWLRVHLIVDHISGMTDEFALETYQMLEGINLMRT